MGPIRRLVLASNKRFNTPVFQFFRYGGRISCFFSHDHADLFSHEPADLVELRNRVLLKRTFCRAECSATPLRFEFNVLARATVEGGDGGGGTDGPTRGSVHDGRGPPRDNVSPIEVPADEPSCTGSVPWGALQEVQWLTFSSGRSGLLRGIFPRCTSPDAAGSSMRRSGCWLLLPCERRAAGGCMPAELGGAYFLSSFRCMLVVPQANHPFQHVFGFSRRRRESLCVCV